MSHKDAGMGKVLTAGILFLSLAGVIYFGFLALRDEPRPGAKNPFEYDIESYKKKDATPNFHREVQRITLDFALPRALAVAGNGKVYVAGDQAVAVFNADGTAAGRIDIPGPARCLAADAEGTLYLGLGDRLAVYDSAGRPKSEWPSLGEKAVLTSVALSRAHVYAADAGNRIVWKYDRQGKLLGRIGEKNESRDIPGFIIPSPFFDVAVDPDGFLWAANTGRHSLENYTEGGDFRTSWGESGMDWPQFCGCCNPSHFVILSDGSVVTSEKGIARVKVYNRIGNLVSILAGPEEFQEGTVGLDLARDGSDRIYLLDPPGRLVRIFVKKGEAPAAGDGRKP